MEICCFLCVMLDNHSECYPNLSSDKGLEIMNVFVDAIKLTIQCNNP